VAAQEAKEMCVIASDHCLQPQEGVPVATLSVSKKLFLLDNNVLR
jgi:hypothetical protein